MNGYRISSTALCLGLLVFSCAGKKAKNAGPPAPPTGWHQEAGWAGSCYFPPDFGKMGEGDRRIAWQGARDALISQWQGQRNDGVKFNERAVESVETTLLGQADKIQVVVGENLRLCQEAMASGSTIAWSNWFDALNDQLTAGECPWPKFAVTLYDYLNLNNDWQIPANVCKGDKVVIKASAQDYFRLDPGGPWVNLEGSGEPGNGLPCSASGCLKGMLVLRFTGQSGFTQVYPVGIESTFVAPEDGRIHVMVNDDNLSDNVYKVENRLEHHASIDYSPGT